jgi:preprotein translocase subunit SecA
MFNFLKKIIGDGTQRAVKQIDPIIQEINRLEPEFRALTDEALAARTGELRQRFQEMTVDQIKAIDEQFTGQNLFDISVQREYQRKIRAVEDDVLDELLPEAFAAVRETSRRTIGQRHYDVQLIGGIVLHQGKIAEMKTGEGKTLVATLPLYLNAIPGKGCHLVTVNEYLAKVGAGWMAPIYHLLGLSVAVIGHEYSAIYDPDFVDPNANQEDRRLIHWRACTRRQAYEADITYGTNNEFGFDYLRDNMAIDQAQVSQRELNFGIVDEVDNILIDEARTPLIISGPSSESSEEYKRFARLVPGMRQSPYTPDQVKKEFIDDPRGDFMVDPRSKGIQMTDTGIAKIEKMLGIPDDESLYDPKYYTLTHFLDNAMKAQFIYHRDRDYVVERNGEVVIVDEFTGRKMPGRRWSDGLHQAVEAKEGVPIKQENVTLATITFQNFFRMYKKLGGMTGTASTEKEEFGKIYNLEVVTIPTNKPMVRQDMSDQIYRTEQAKFEAVMREISEMQDAGRPVLVGTTAVETSERLSALLNRHGIRHEVLNAKQHEREAWIVAQAGRLSKVTIATNMAGRGTDILLGGNPDGLVEEILEERGLKFEEATPEQRREAWEEAKHRTEDEGARVRELGGLHIVGTERHEARRIDNQLRGRSGRQGDPGSSRFFLSLEDELMQRFGAMDRVKGIMERLGVEEDIPIEAGMINRAIEGAQTRVEGYNFDIRKHTVEFDDVMNKQRTVIYADRRAILNGQSMRDRVLEMIGAELNGLVEQHLPEESTVRGNMEEWDVDALLRAVRTIDPLLRRDIEDTFEGRSRQEIEDILLDQVEEDYEAREEAIGEENMRYVERRMMLAAIDRQWVDYLTGMEDLRQEIGLQAIAQRDPLIEYQRNAYRLFDDLKENIQRDIVYQMMPASFQYEAAIRQAEIEQQQRLAAARQAGMSEEQARAARTVRKAVQLPGRNDLCPCGSGKKFKACHLGREEELLALMQSGTIAPTAPAAPHGPQTVSAQLASGGSGLQPPVQAPVQRGRAVPPASNTPGQTASRPNGGKSQRSAPRGKQTPPKKRSEK